MDIKRHFNNKYLWFLISTGIIASLIYFADASRFIESVRSADPVFMIPAVIFGMSVFPIWGYVWYRVFQKSGIRMPYRKSIRIFMAGNFMNSITPMGQAGGEPIMAYLLEKNSNASYEKAISSIFSADIMNTTPPITFTLGGTIYLLLFDSVNSFVLQAAYMVLFGTVIGGTVAYLLWFESGTIEGKIKWVVKEISERTGRGEHLVVELEEKLSEVEKTFNAIGEDPIYLLKTSLVSHAGFLMQIFNFTLIAASLGYYPDFTPIYFIVVLSGLSNFTPVPGANGAYEAAMAGLTTVFLPYISAPEALTIAVLFRLSTYWPGLAAGWFALNSLNGEVQKQ
jgi:uncharacterized protein (TIRG00374 family)